MMKKIHLISMAGLLVFAAILAGCLVTGTVVITARLAPDNDGNSILIADQNFNDAKLLVNIHEDATFKDYRDDIRNIDNIGFYASVTNNGNTDAKFQLFLEPDTSINYESVDEMLDSLVDIIFTDLTVPANQTVTINWNESMEYVTNLDFFKGVLEGGVFSIYPAAIPRDDFSITIDSLVVIVTLTGSK